MHSGIKVLYLGALIYLLFQGIDVKFLQLYAPAIIIGIGILLYMYYCVILIIGWEDGRPGKKTEVIIPKAIVRIPQ